VSDDFALDDTAGRTAGHIRRQRDRGRDGPPVSAAAAAHGVARGDARFLQSLHGAAIAPLMYLARST
jgi:hypothetical protein